MTGNNKTPTPEESSSLRDQVERLTNALQAAEKVISELQECLKATLAERDSSKESLYAMIPYDDASFTQEEMERLVQHGVTWDVIEQDLMNLLEN